MSKKQKLVATSTIEAKYIVINVCTKQYQFLVALLREIDYAWLVGECLFQLLIKGNSNIVNEIRPV